MNTFLKELVDTYDEFSNWLENEKKINNKYYDENLQPTLEEFITWIDEHKLK